ncbi:MAG: NAD(P)/FAD-dependent oxidoreductase [Blastocatellia bacterium]
MKYDVIVVGGGAAGLLCAIEAGKRDRRTLVVEHNAQLGRKIIISGGGRCNFTNTNTNPDNFISRNPHFAKSALAGYTPQDFIELVKSHKVEFYEKKLGQLFCRERSEQVVEMLVAECRKAKVKIETSCSVSEVRRDSKFVLETTHGRFECESLVIATGGSSFPKIGATDFGYRIAKQFGLKTVQTRPSLVPLISSDASGYGKLAGISFDAAVSTNGHTFRENVLFTHRGFSGPAILQISNYWDKNVSVEIDLIPGIDAKEILSANPSSRQTVSNFLGKYLPARIAAMIVERESIDKPIYQLSRKELQVIAEVLNAWKVNFHETEGLHKAEVTLGGVSTEELSSQTMESKKVQGLYFIGEVVDVTGWLGGYNFQWAWSSGFAAGNAV